MQEIAQKYRDFVPILDRSRWLLVAQDSPVDDVIVHEGRQVNQLGGGPHRNRIVALRTADLRA